MNKADNFLYTIQVFFITRGVLGRVDFFLNNDNSSKNIPWFNNGTILFVCVVIF